MTATTSKNLMALDVGDRRIGIAVASAITKLPRPLNTIFNDQNSISAIQKIIKNEEIGLVVVGLPRDMSGQETQQTKSVLSFGQALEAKINLPIHWQDEALTSQKAKEELSDRGVRYNKEHVDALAATYILNDFLLENGEERLL